MLKINLIDRSRVVFPTVGNCRRSLFVSAFLVGAPVLCACNPRVEKTDLDVARVASETPFIQHRDGSQPAAGVLGRRADQDEIDSENCREAYVELSRMAKEYEETGDFDGAISAYRQAAEICPGFYDGALSKVLRIYLDKEDFAAAAAVSKEMGESGPRFLDKAIKNIVERISRENKYDMAGFTKNVGLFLETVREHLGNVLLTETYLKIGEIYEDNFDDLMTALDYYEKAAEFSESGEAQKALFHIAGIYEYRLDNPKGALFVYQEILARFSNLSYKISGNRQQGKYKVGSGNRIDLEFYLAALYQGLNDPQKALEIYQDIANRNPGASEANGAWRAIGGVFEKQHKFLEAAGAFAECTDSSYLLTAAYFYIRYGNTGRGDFERAKEVLLKIVREKERRFSPDNIFDAKSLLAVLENPELRPELESLYVSDIEVFRFKGTNTHLVYNGEDLNVLIGKVEVKPGTEFRGGYVADPPGLALGWIYKPGTIITFLNAPETISRKAEVLEIFDLLPNGFFANLKYIIISSRPDPNKVAGGHVGGRYLGAGVVILFPTLVPDEYGGFQALIGSGANIHEVIHHWDLGITDQSPDPSDIYYSISWIRSEDGFRILTNDPGEFFVSGAKREHPTSNPKEDFACAATAYVMTPVDFRRTVRENLAMGKLELAVKYLFIKYVTPFDGKEYEVSQNSPGMDFEEVEYRLNEVLRENPARVRGSTLRALREIKRLSEKQEDRGSRGCGGCSGCTW